MNPNPWITSPTYWRVCATAARGARRAGLVAVLSLAVLLVEAVVLVVAGERGAGRLLTGAASQAAWAGAFLVPVWIILGRLERTAAAYARAGRR
ncbi:MAG: hypothetical protein QOJ23_4828 [Actinomycetota bacterium]|jgi:hypothetical protein|nr:hypothetical protein [Actinomycetota bacterium]MDQ1502147.1 hypothetical protein [Actinomycetota bacterium]